MPIHLTTSFVFESSEQAAACSTWSAVAVYSRISNPTNAVLEQRMARWKAASAPSPPPAGGPLHLGICHADGRGRPHRRQHGAVRRQPEPVALHAARFGIETTFVKPGDLDAWRRHPPQHANAVRRNRGNPGLDVLDIPAVAQIAHEPACRCWWIPPSPRPWLMKPFDHGADLGLPLGPAKFLRPWHRDRRRAGRTAAASDWDGRAGSLR